MHTNADARLTLTLNSHHVGDLRVEPFCRTMWPVTRRIAGKAVITVLLFLFGVFGWCSFAQSPLTGRAQNAFTIVNRGGVPLATEGAGGSVGVGYATLQIMSGTVVPSGVAILGYRTRGVLVSEVGVPVSPLLLSGRIYVEVNGPVNTGVAIANPSNQDATISFSFTDETGADFGSGSTVIPAYGQISRFLDQEPFRGGSNIRGAFSFSSSTPVSVIALRGLINERQEFLMGSLPVVDTAQAASSSPVTLAHFADGAEWATQILLVNPGDSTISGTIRLSGPAGEALETFPFSIPRRSSFKQLTHGTGTVSRSGSVRIEPNAGSVTPASVAIFSYRPAGVTISEAAVAAVTGTSLRMFTEAAVSGSLAKQSGVAVTNLSSSSATVTFEQAGLDGSILASASLTLPGNGQAAKFLSDIFNTQTLPLPVQGVLRIAAPPPGVSIVGLRSRYNERGEFLITTTPPATESPAASPALTSYVFPEVANGGGYTTEFLLFGRSDGQSTSGKVRFINYDGSLPLSLNCPALQDAGSTFPEPIRQVNPQYTDAARQARVSGTVVMQATVLEDGSVSVNRLLQTIGYGLDENAQSAIAQWRFCPGTLDGRPIAVTLTIEVSFRIS